MSDWMIAPKVLDQARGMALSQSYFPVSPAARDAEGKLCLCAAALMAAAGLREFASHEAAGAFASDLERRRDKQAMFDVFQQLQWPAELCAAMVKRNDASAERDRTAVFLAMLEQVEAGKLLQ
jgi:hypothetical protein